MKSENTERIRNQMLGNIDDSINILETILFQTSDDIKTERIAVKILKILRKLRIRISKWDFGSFDFQELG